ncbi:hypothetical protein CKJ74_17775 [Mycobacterium avium]|nr:hypothetical protein CKJ74_17775 [Mycobacterium avium]
MVVSPQRLTRWPSYVRDRHAAITYTTPRDAPSNRATPLCGTQLCQSGSLMSGSKEISSG